VWETKARFCPLCATELREVALEGQARLRCDRCAFILYANPASASCAVVVRDRSVCLVKRNIEPYRGHWTLPAGYQEYFETAEDAAIRETREECGLEIEILGLLGVMYTTDDARKRANLTVYLARPIGGSLGPGDDAQDAGFFEVDALPESIGFQNNRRVLEAIRRACPPGEPLERLAASLGGGVWYLDRPNPTIPGQTP
jgi:ADP-ribose pyrophosphatase YjhB (NUDIX family)